MPAGLIIVNTSGTVLIDETYANLAMRAKGNTTVLTGSLDRATVSMSGMSSPMIALACANGFVGVKNVNPSLTSFLVQGKSPPSSNFDWYTFDVPLASGINQGLQVFDAAGGLVFDSNNKYARVVDIFGGATTAAWTATRTYPAGRTYAVVQLKTPYRKEVVAVGGSGGFDVTWYMAGSKVVSNAVTCSMLMYKQQNVASAPAAVTDYSAQFAVLDVTGY